LARTDVSPRTRNRKRTRQESRSRQPKRHPNKRRDNRLAALVRHGDGEVEAPQRWRPRAAFVLSIAGLAVSTYLTITHFFPGSLVCSGSGLVDCAKVTTSAQSRFLGVPVAIWGLGFFVAMTALNFPAAWRVADPRVHLLRLVMTVGGMCFVLYLVSAELLIIKNICLWCTSVHAITFLLFVLTVATVPQMLGWGAARYRTA
jgi:uncharacterized membrane protein